MQAQKVVPPDLLCKDKFLVQSTVVPFGTTEDDITSEMFSKDGEKYVEERKLRVVLVSPLHSPVLLPNNGELKKHPSYDASLHKDILLNGIENIPPPQRLAKDILGSENAEGVYELGLRAVKDAESSPSNDIEESESANDIVKLKLIQDFGELKSKLDTINSEPRKSDQTIMQLNEERNVAARENEMLKREVEVLKRKNGMRRIQVGFPLLYVFMVALIGLAFGYLIHP